MADRFGQLRKFVIGFGTLKPWKVRRRMRFSRSAAQGVLGSNLFSIHLILELREPSRHTHSYSSINDITRSIFASSEVRNLYK